MLVTSVLVATYFLYAFTVTGLVLCVQRCDRFSAISIALCFPFLLIAGVFAAFASSPDDFLKPCPQGLEEAEALVERKRQIMFQGRPMQPKIALSWKRRYAMAVEFQAHKVRELSIEVQHLLATV
jgi:hypothetical protein